MRRCWCSGLRGNSFRVSSLPILSVVAFVLLGFLSVGSARADWKIVPGKRIGEIQIGMAHADVIRLLGAPDLEEDLGETDRSGELRPGGEPTPKLNGILRDDWITPLAVSLNPDTDDPIFMCNFVTVYISLKDRRVVQIEVRAPRFKTVFGSSSESSALELRKQYPRYQTTFCVYHHPSSGGIPANKHFIIFEDAVGDGIAWRYGAMGDLAPDPDPADELETIIVHASRKPALLDPDGGSRFIWKDAPARRGKN
jgi:hypothetical protein